MTDAQQLVVVLDAGHGDGQKVGGSSANNATGPNGLLEKDVALDIAKRTASALASHAHVVLTRATDVNLSLADRAAVARANHADVFLSIHANGFHDPTVDGTEVWVARAAGHESVDLGQSVLHQLLAVTGAPDRGVRRADLGVLLPQRHGPGTAACLAEIAFLTNPAEAARLTQDSYKNQLAQALATAVLSHALVPAGVGGAPATTNGHGSMPGARSVAIVEPEIDYSASSMSDVIRIWADWLARYGQWVKGVPDSMLTVFPHAAVCQLKLYTAGGDLAWGTGFYIGKETLLTCGHNFWDDDDHWRTVRVEVQPGHSPRMSTLASKEFTVNPHDIVHPKWRDSADATHDLAVLRVPGLPATAGSFELANRSFAPSVGIVVCGYGKVDGTDYANQGQRMDGAHISEADTEMVYYPMLTMGGHSGSPVFHDGMVIGVHTGPRRGNPHQNRGVLLNPEKEDWIRQMAGTSLGLGLGLDRGPRAYALTDQNSPQPDQSLEVSRHIAQSLGQAETGNRFDLITMDSNRVNFGIASWTGGEIADLLDVYTQVAAANGTTQAMVNLFGGQAGFDAIRNRFRTQEAAATITPAERTALQRLGADASLHDAQVQKLTADVRGYLTDIGDHGNPWYPWIDGGMGAISEVAAHVLVHARHQSGRAGFRRALRDAIAHFGGEAALGRQIVNHTVTELDFLHQVGEEVANHVLADLQAGVQNRYRTLLRSWSGSVLAFYFHPVAAPAPAVPAPAAPAPAATHAMSLAASIGGMGAAHPRSAAADPVNLGYGVAGGIITDGFYRDEAERNAITGRSSGRKQHLGIDVSTTNAHGGGADDPRRGLPVFAVLKRSIPISDLNSVRAINNGVSSSGLAIDGHGNAELSHAIVLAQPWGDHGDMAYGGVVGMACRYGYTKTDGSAGTLTLYVEFLHLITPDYLPKNGDGAQISAEAWAATGKGIGFGPRIQNNARLTADELCAGDPILVGHLGATQFPHCHIQAAYGAGEQRYLRQPRIDPAVLLRQSATTSAALAFAAQAPSLALNGSSFTYDVPGDVEPQAQPTPMTCWATAAAMLVSWRDRTSHPISAVCDIAGPGYRSRFDTDQGLSQADKPDFLHRLGLQEEPPANYTLQAYLDMLRRFGPLWVTTDVGSSGYVAVHARIMTGAYGDGTPAGTSVWLIDPADGRRHHETFEQFVQTFEQLARDVAATDPLWIQVVHNAGR